MTPILETIPALYHIAEASKFPVCTQHVERQERYGGDSAGEQQGKIQLQICMLLRGTTNMRTKA